MANDSMPRAGTGSTGYLSSIAASYAAAGGGMPTGGGSASQDPPVWTGHTTGLLDPITGAPKPYTNTRKVPHRASEVIGEFDSWSLKRKKALARKLIQAGYLPATGSSLDEAVANIPLADLEKAWQSVVMETAQKNANGIWVTPQQLIQQRVDYALDAAKGTKMEDFLKGTTPKEEKPFSGTKEFTSVSRDIFSASEAKGVIRGVLQQELGRDPTAEEFQDFIDALQTEQRQNPSRTTTSTVYREGDAVSQSSTTTGGIDPGEFALQQAQANPDWAEWQAVGTYFPAAMDTLGAGVQGV